VARPAWPPPGATPAAYHSLPEHPPTGLGDGRTQSRCSSSGALGGTALGTLVLGAGAGRLAYDLHQQLPADNTVALDFNPLLALVAARAVSGEGVELWEFPVAPRSIGDHAVLRTLVAPEPVRDGFHLILGDVLRPPLVTGSIDVVVTPWVVDILPEDFRHFAARVNGRCARWPLDQLRLAFSQPEAAALQSGGGPHVSDSGSPA
jgi:hypothetical protein